jgi:hypothetical protein
MPKMWVNAYFGTFSRKKLFFMCEFLGITPEYMDIDMTLPERLPFATLVQRHLNKEHAAGRTVFEDDNTTPMSMGYSAQ